MNRDPAGDRAVTRRQFIEGAAAGAGALGLTALATGGAAAASTTGANALASRTPRAPSAKSVIWLFMAGGPSQLDLFDPKPELVRRNGQIAPRELLGDGCPFLEGSPRLLGSPFRFARHGQSGTEVSELLPHTAAVVDDIAILRGVRTDARHHAPAQLLWNTGSVEPGRPSLGAWVQHLLGTGNGETGNTGRPDFAVLLSGGGRPAGGAWCWQSAGLPGNCRGVTCSATDAWAQRQLEAEPETVRQWYGVHPGRASFANHCLLARQMVEQGSRFVQLYHRGWDSHGTGPNDDLLHALPADCREVDRPAAALVADLKQRGLLDSTLVVWGGEFGRAPFLDSRNGSTWLGRDHHPRAFTLWMAGGGIKPGGTLGQTDEFGYRAVAGEIHFRDVQGTILGSLGIDPRRLMAPDPKIKR